MILPSDSDYADTLSNLLITKDEPLQQEMLQEKVRGPYPRRGN